MRALAVALASLGLLDALLAFGARLRRSLAAGAAAVLTAAVGAVLVGYPAGQAVVLGATVAVEAPLWVAARRGGPPGPLLAALSAALLTRVATAGLWHGGTASAFDRWVAAAPFDVLRTGEADRVAYAAGAVVFLAAAGNTFVRLLLRSVGSLTTNDAKAPGGGRVIGSIERVLIFALAIAGEPTAATLIISAKGILRFAEVRSTSEEDVDRVTEYVLVGSLASYALALAFVVLA